MQGEDVRIVEASIAEGRLCFLIENSNGEVGWFESPTEYDPEILRSSGLTMFEGTFAAG